MLDDQNGDDDQEGLADETGTVFQREMGADPGAGQIADGHGQADGPENGAVAGEEGDGREVGGEIDHLGAGRGAHKVHAEDADEAENQKTAGARPEEAVVEADHQAEQGAAPKIAGTRFVRFFLAEILAQEGVDGDGQHHDDDQRPHCLARNPGDHGGAEPGADECGGGGR